MKDLPIVWLTGATGQVGTALRTLFPSPELFRWLAPGRDEFDLTDFDSVSSFVDDTKPDLVVNCAAFTNVNLAESHPAEAEVLNADLPALVFGLVGRGIHLSSNYVFPSRVSAPYSEAEKPEPQGESGGVYGMTKLFGERKALALGATVIRTAWVYSPASWGRESFYSKIRKQLQEGKEVRAVTDEVGNPTSALTLARGIHELLVAHYSQCRPLRNETLHLTDLGVASRYDFATRIAELSHSGAEIHQALMKDFPSPVTRPAEALLSPGTLSEVMTPPTWEEALREVIKLDNNLENNRG